MPLDYVWDKAKEDRTQEKAIFIDEVWQLIGASSNRLAAEFVLEFSKLSEAMVVLQSVLHRTSMTSFLWMMGSTEKVLSITVRTKIVLNLEDEEAQRVQHILNLSDTEIMNITHFARGTV